MPDLLDERLEQIRERVRIGTVREACADRDFLMVEVDRLRWLLAPPVQAHGERHSTTCDLLVGRGRRVCSCRPVGDPGAVVEADPYGRSVDAP